MDSGIITARGAQDMKSVGVQTLLAVRDLIREGWTPLRDVHISWVPDEEIGGLAGMAKLVKSDKFRNLKIGFAMDEGQSHVTKNMPEEQKRIFFLHLHFVLRCRFDFSPQAGLWH